MNIEEIVDIEDKKSLWVLPTLSVSEDDFNREQEIKRLQNIIDIVSNIKD